MNSDPQDFVEIRIGKPSGKWRAKEPDDPNDPVPHEVFRHRAYSSATRVIAGSIRGEKNAHLGKYREDAFAVKKVSPYFLAAVADGAGSCRLARVGAQISAHYATENISQRLEALSSSSPQEHTGKLKKIIVDSLWDTLIRTRQEAKNRGVSVKELSSTLLVGLGFLGGGDSFFISLQVGDGLIASWSPGGRIQIIGRPDLGAYAGESVFLVDLEDKRQLEDRVTMTPIRETGYIALMSDGISGDFYPPDKGLNPLFSGINEQILFARDPEKALFSFIRYKRPGSFDDRTLVLQVYDALDSI